MGLTADFHHIISSPTVTTTTTTPAIILRISDHGRGMLCRCTPEMKCEVVLFQSAVVNSFMLTVVEDTGQFVDLSESSVVQVSVISVDFSSYQNKRPC
jgi:hypothetical protein